MGDNEQLNKNNMDANDIAAIQEMTSGWAKLLVWGGSKLGITTLMLFAMLVAVGVVAQWAAENVAKPIVEAYVSYVNKASETLDELKVITQKIQDNECRQTAILEESKQARTDIIKDQSTILENQKQTFAEHKVLIDSARQSLQDHQYEISILTKGSPPYPPIRPSGG